MTAKRPRDSQRNSRPDETPTERPIRGPLPSHPMLELPEGMTNQQAWMAGVLCRVDADAEVTRDEMIKLRKELGTAPDPTTGDPGSGLKAQVAQLLEDRRFYRLLAGSAAAVITVAELVRLAYTLIE
jgi:hypothetical protein